MPFRRKALALVASLTLITTLAACSDSETQETDAASPVATTASATPETETTKATPSPTPTPSPTKNVMPTLQVGDTAKLPSADITVNLIEERDVIESSDPSFQPPVTAEGGNRLWYFDMTWTNRSSQAVDKECHGPYSVNLTAYDINGNQMLMIDQPGFIPGQNCQTGLLTGETGTWLTGFRGSDADFGWAVFEDYEGGMEIFVADPSVELEFTEDF